MNDLRILLIFDFIVSCPIPISNIFVAFHHINFLKLNALSWEQRKLGDIFEEYSEKNHAELPPLTIIQGGGTIRRDESDRTLQYDKASLSNYKLVNKDDFIVHLRSFEGGLEKASSRGIISPAYHVFHGEGTDSRFYYAYFRSKKFIDTDLKPHVYGIRDGRSIDIEGMKTIKIPYTSYAEQEQIGDFISNMDALITLHQSKVDSWKNRKNQLLTLSWEQRKLRDISSLITKGTTPLDKSGDGDVNFIKVENLDSSSGEVISCSKISRAEHEGYLKRSQLKKNDILFSIAGTLGRVGIVKSNILPANTNQALAIIRTKEGDLEYIATVLRGRAVTDFIRRNPTVGAQPNLSLEQVGNLEIPYPSLHEQRQIGSYFESLDTLITLHQSKLERIQMCNYRSVLYGSF